MIFTITNQKGGVGKTTTALNIGVYLALKNQKVLLVDIDPQANLTSGIGTDHDKEKDQSVYNLFVDRVSAKKLIKKTRVKNLEILPSSIHLAAAEVEMVNSMSRENILRNALHEVDQEYDFIIIDCPPSLGLITINGQVAADNILIPVQTEYFALEGLGQLINTIKLVKANLNPQLEIGGVILTMFDTRTNLSKDVAREIQKYFGDKLFDTVVPRNIRLSEAPSHGLSIYEYDPLSTGGLAYDRLSSEILERFKNIKTGLVKPNIGS